MNFWAVFSVTLVVYLMYFGYFSNEMQQIKSISIVTYESLESKLESIIDKIDPAITMFANLHNGTVKIWDAILNNGKKIDNLDEKVNMLFSNNKI
ncbi:gp16 [Cyclophragma undans nucleopolyhedrovirus]|uniref:Gp16 n=1 Tax=Cyclophragma undans nucleopolyhedrovirus TaxID=1906244 RepID=A0A288QYL5_9ABAC|nr:gp16 [Cyclophragma undans nucleopolyhedrovirus]AOT85494.1 gp16 [Cyclophragma undans nucleopolyhedrovirus]